MTLPPAVVGYKGEMKYNNPGALLVFLFRQWAGRCEGDEERRKLNSMVAFLLGLKGGPNGEGMPRDVFILVLDTVLPPWDLLCGRL